MQTHVLIYPLKGWSFPTHNSFNNSIIKALTLGNWKFIKNALTCEENQKWKGVLLSWNKWSNWDFSCRSHDHRKDARVPSRDHKRHPIQMAKIWGDPRYRDCNNPPTLHLQSAGNRVMALWNEDQKGDNSFVQKFMLSSKFSFTNITNILTAILRTVISCVQIPVHKRSLKFFTNKIFEELFDCFNSKNPRSMIHV